MKNLINIYILLLLVVCSTLSSCSDWLDVNNNPNTAEKVEAIRDALRYFEVI